MYLLVLFFFFFFFSGGKAAADQPLFRDYPKIPRREGRFTSLLRPSSLTAALSSEDARRKRRKEAGSDDDADDEVDDRTPLVQASSEQREGFHRYGTSGRATSFTFRPRKSSASTASSPFSPGTSAKSPAASGQDPNYDVNNPPSIPNSPTLAPSKNYDDAVVTGADFDFSSTARSQDRRASTSWPVSNDMLIDVDDSGDRPPNQPTTTTPSSPRLSRQDALRRSKSIALPAAGDVCFPNEGMSELAEDERGARPEEAGEAGERRRRRNREWPDLSVLEEFSREEKEGRSGDLRVKKISEPMLIEGRLRPQFRTWQREDDESPYRFTYFNEEFQSTIHAQTFSELVQPGGSFRELFIPDPPELDDSTDDDDGDDEVYDMMDAHPGNNNHNGNSPRFNEAEAVPPGEKPKHHRLAYMKDHHNHNVNVNNNSETASDRPSSTAGSTAAVSGPKPPKVKRYGPRPTFWLDVLCPTDAEMRVIAKAFGIHALTAEDIMMQEAREKVELFRNYYFVNYRTFEQDPNSENYLKPVNMYAVVFREGVLSFHFSPSPHPANVRRRIRQLMDYLILSADWISYALIDDITDVFGPLIQAIEKEVDEIDEIIMQMHSRDVDNDDNGGHPSSVAPGEMLRRVGECRKKVMGMYRLLSNKADVVKGFAKRCNEQWEVAPKSEIGLYLGDIQDHILTMTSNLTHYET